MKPATKAKVALTDAITTMFIAFRQPMDNPTLDVYVKALEAFPINRVTEAIATVLRTEQFLPSPGRILSLGGLVVSTDTRARIAFEALGKAVESQGRYKSIQFDDPILTQTVKAMGGWEAVCDEPADNWHVHFKRDFINEYKANCERRRGSNSVLLGEADRVNGGNGLERREAVKIAVDLPQLPGIAVDKPRIAAPQVSGLLENIGKMS